MHIVKWVVLTVVALLTIGLDLGTKRAAEDSLANGLHVLPIVITAKEDGKPLSEVVKARFGDSVDTARVRPGDDSKRRIHARK